MNGPAARPRAFTRDQLAAARDRVISAGQPLSEWCREHRLDYGIVSHTLMGRTKGLRGEAFRAAVLLGLRPAPSMCGTAEPATGSSAVAVIDRMRWAIRASCDNELAQLIPAHPNTLSVWRSRDAVPLKAIVRVSDVTGYSTRWLRLGEGDRRSPGSKPRLKLHLDGRITCVSNGATGTPQAEGA